MPRVQYFNRFNRRYYRRGEYTYPYPCDEDQADLWDAFHMLLYDVALEGSLHSARLDNQLSPRVLDVGYGTGIWCLDMEQRYPNADIVGMDLVPWGIAFSPSNLRQVHVDFVTDPWPVPSNSQDLIHLALLSGSVPSWKDLFLKAFKHLKPVTGQIEFVEIDWKPRTPEGVAFPLSGEPLREWWSLLSNASSRSGFSIWCADHENTEKHLEAAGFVETSHQKIRIPINFSQDIDERLYKLSIRWRGCVGPVWRDDGAPPPNAFASLSMMHLTNSIDMSERDALEVCKKAEETLDADDSPVFINLYFWTARKPGQQPGDGLNGSHHPNGTKAETMQSKRLRPHSSKSQSSSVPSYSPRPASTLLQRSVNGTHAPSGTNPPNTTSPSNRTSLPNASSNSPSPRGANDCHSPRGAQKRSRLQ